MSYLRYLCFLGYSGVQHLLCCVFPRLVYPMLPVFLDCPFLIAPSVFSNVHPREILLGMVLGLALIKMSNLY